VGTYATSAELQVRMPYRTISASTKPTTTNVESWITESEGKLHGALKAAQISTPITDSDGIQQMKSWVLAYCEGRLMVAFGSTGDDDERDDGRDLINAFELLLAEIQKSSAMYEAMLTGGSASASTRRMRSHVTDHVDGQSVSAGDFAPAFTKKAAEDQF